MAERNAGHVTGFIPLTDFHCRDEANPFSRAGGARLIEHTLRVAGGLVPVRIIAQNNAIAEQARSHGLTDVEIDPWNGASYWAFASRCASRADTENAIVLGPMSPLLQPETVQVALERFGQIAPRPVVSIRRLIQDHPFKLRHLDADGRCVDFLFGSLRYEPQAGGIIHGKTGKPICFRQNLPPVYTATSGLAILRTADASELASIVEAGAYEGIDSPDLLEVDGVLALLRAELRMESRVKFSTHKP